jgi:hypothetical protein
MRFAGDVTSCSVDGAGSRLRSSSRLTWWLPPALLSCSSSSSRPLLLLLSSAVTTLSGGTAALMVSGRWRLMCPPSACPDANVAPHAEHSCAAGLPGAAVRRLSVVVTAAAVASCSGRRGCCFLSLLWLVRWPPRAWKEGKHLLHVLHSYDDDDTPAHLRLVLLGVSGAGIIIGGCGSTTTAGPWARRMRHLAMSASSSSSSCCVVVLPLREEDDEASDGKDEQWRRRLLVRCFISLGPPPETMSGCLVPSSSSSSICSVAN